MTPETLSLQRAERDPEAIAEIRHRTCAIASGWRAWFLAAGLGLVLGVKLVSLSLRTLRTDFEPDRGACFACARCFRSCPQGIGAHRPDAGERTAAAGSPSQPWSKHDAT